MNLEIDQNKCFYCGEDKQCMDHIVPYSFDHIKKRHSGQRACSKDNLVSCCNECNSMAGDKGFNNIYEKKEFVQGRLTERYKKIINMANWTEDEISEMGPEFKTDLRLQMLAKKWIQNRINYPEIIFEEQPIREELRKILSKFGL